jgi:hypothetical protein
MRSPRGALSSRQEAIMQNQDTHDRIFEAATGLGLVAGAATLTALLHRLFVAAAALFEAAQSSGRLF